MKRLPESFLRSDKDFSLFYVWRLECGCEISLKVRDEDRLFATPGTPRLSDVIAQHVCPAPKVAST